MESTRTPIRLYTDEELDIIEQTDPGRAYRIARAQALATRAPPPPSGDLAPPDPERVRQAVEDVRHILNRDGGDIEFVGINGSIVQVRMKGACVGCPNSVLDLRNVVEKVLMGVHGVRGVVNLY
ncbi:MAG: NifU family protein [Acidiferrobacteraceae bacterium]